MSGGGNFEKYNKKDPEDSPLGASQEGATAWTNGVDMFLCMNKYNKQVVIVVIKALLAARPRPCAQIPYRCINGAVNNTAASHKHLKSGVPLIYKEICAHGSDLAGRGTYGVSTSARANARVLASWLVPTLAF